jgi:hypothetical protein
MIRTPVYGQTPNRAGAMPHRGQTSILQLFFNRGQTSIFQRFYCIYADFAGLDAADFSFQFRTEAAIIGAEQVCTATGRKSVAKLRSDPD